MLRLVLSIYADNLNCLEINRQMQLVQMGVMQFIAVTIIYIESLTGFYQAHVFAIALSIISVTSIDINLEALQKNC